MVTSAKRRAVFDIFKHAEKYVKEYTDKENDEAKKEGNFNVAYAH
jgi:hypothetical protein